jgi:hypothetical protein
MFMCQLIGFGEKEKEKEKAKIDDRGGIPLRFGWLLFCSHA